MSRPTLETPKDSSDKILEIIGLAALVGLLVFPLLYFGDLPAVIPTHFGSNGKPDGFSCKWMIWLLPGIGLIMYLILSFLNKFPKIFNYPVKITEANAFRQFMYAQKLLRGLKAMLACLFCYLNYSTIQVALGKQSGVSNEILILFVFGILGIVGFYLFWAYKNK